MKRSSWYSGDRHPPACTCAKCNRARLERLGDSETWRSGRGRDRKSSSRHPVWCNCARCTSNRVRQTEGPSGHRNRPEILKGRRRRKRGHRWLKWTVASIVFITVAWAWAYHQDIPAAVDTWRMISVLGGELTGSSDEIGAPEPPPVIIVVTATPQPVLVATVIPNPVPSATPVPNIISPAPAVSANSGESTAAERSDEKYVGGELLDAREIEIWVIEFTNQERSKAGLQPFVHDPAISEIARSHSRNMIAHSYGHVVFGKDPTDRALEAGYDCRAYHEDGSYSYGLSENIFRHGRVTQWEGTSWNRVAWSWRPATYIVDDRDMARELVEGWMDSLGHRANILDSDSRRIGVGVAIEKSPKYGYISETIYATQNFSSCR